MVSTGGNRDLVSAIGNDGGARVMSTTNFNQPQGNPEMGHHLVNYSNSIINAFVGPTFYFVGGWG